MEAIINQNKTFEIKFVDASSDVKELSSEETKKLKEIFDSMDEKDIQDIHKALREFPKEEDKELVQYSY